VVEVGTGTVLGNVTETVPAAGTSVVAVKPTVQVALCPATNEPSANVTVLTTLALAIVAVPRSTMAMTMAPAVNLLMR
jgi:hypothetical protein